jgi:sugar lactone lactonase YvrE
MPSAPPPLLLLQLFFVSAAFHIQPEAAKVAWFRIFGSATPRNVVPSEVKTAAGEQISLKWTEGPVLRGRSLIFSDTIANRIYEWKIGSDTLEVVKENSGDAPAADTWRAEPGSNGLALTSDEKIVLCQHGAQRLALMDPVSGITTPIAAEWESIDEFKTVEQKIFNGPNDVTLRSEDGQTYAYFTDPVYAWLEKERFADLPYLDEKVRTEGAGACGVYRVPVDGSAAAERLFVMDRPNGIQFMGDSLIVSDCCQGPPRADNPTCFGGRSRWIKYERTVGFDRRSKGKQSWHAVKTLEDELHYQTPGCADGFKVDPASGLVIGSCAGGLCLVDTDSGSVVARLMTTAGDDGFRVSNVVIGEGPAGDVLYMATEKGIWSLPLNHKSIRAEWNTAKDEL